MTAQRLGLSNSRLAPWQFRKQEHSYIHAANEKATKSMDAQCTYSVVQPGQMQQPRPVSRWAGAPALV